MLNLKEATRLMEITSNPELVDYVTDVQLAGREILKNVSPDEFISAIALIQGAVAADLLKDGELKWFMAVMANRDTFSGMMVIAARVVVGLAEVEGWIK